MSSDPITSNPVTFASARPWFAVFAVPLLAAFAAAQSPAPAGPPRADPTTKATAPPANVVFLHWNDFHGQFQPQLAFWKARAGGDQRDLPRVGGAASLAGYVARTRAEAAATGARVVATDGGDWYQGTIEGNETKGRLAVEFLSRLAPDAAVLGNHEYDFGPENVRALVKAARFPVLGANVLVAGAPQRKLCDYVRPYLVIDVHGLKVAIIGLITVETKAVSTGPWGDAEFGNEVEAVRAVLPAADEASDVVVLLTHCGLEADRALAKAFPELPLILGGHSHTGLKEPYREGSTWIVQTHGKASEVYRIEANVDAANKSLQLLRGELVELDLERNPGDPATAAWIAESTKDLAAQWDRVIGELTTPLNDDRGARSTAAGNLVCDAFLAETGAQLAFSNKGGIRTRLPKGPLTPRMLYELLPFDNNLVSLDLTGAQIRAILQVSLGSGRRPLEIGGGTYRYSVRDGQRVLSEVRVGGAVLDDAATYRIATSSFLARGGDGLEGFAGGQNKKDHGLLLRDVLIKKAEQDKGLTADTGNRILFDEARR